MKAKEIEKVFFMVKCPRERERRRAARSSTTLAGAFAVDTAHESGENWRSGGGHTASFPSSALSWASAVKWGYALLTGPGRIKGDHPASGTELTAECGRDRSQASPG